MTVFNIDTELLIQLSVLRMRLTKTGGLVVQTMENLVKSFIDGVDSSALDHPWGESVPDMTDS